MTSRTTSRTDEDKFIAAMTRKFRAREIPPPPPATSSTPREAAKKIDRPKCALCRRTGRMVGPDADGRVWCPEREWPTCNRIAQSRLGASAGNTANDSLSGILEANGKCRDCGAEVHWAKTQRGKNVPCDVAPAAEGVAGFDLVGRDKTLAFYVSEKKRKLHRGDVYEAHFNTCPEREDD